MTKNIHNLTPEEKKVVWLFKILMKKVIWEIKLFKELNKQEKKFKDNQTLKQNVL